MARYTGAQCKLCRREGMELFLKGERCLGDKCGIKKRNYAPGQHGQRRPKLSEYGIQLREKQKAKKIYGVLEKQFHNYFLTADSMKGVTGESLLILLERRLDNAVLRLGFASSHSQARQLIRHGHILVNNEKINIPSHLVKMGDTVAIKEKSKDMGIIKSCLERVEIRGVPQWLSLDKEARKGEVVGVPTREDVTIPVEEKLIVELYSK